MESRETIVMQGKIFSYRNALHMGWEWFSKRPGFFVSIILIAGISNVIKDNLDTLLGLLGLQEAMPWPLLLSLAILVMLINAVISMGLIRIAIKASVEADVGYHDLIACWSQLPRYMIASILYIIAVGIGLLLFIIPGIFLMVRLQFYAYCLVDENCGIIECLQRSYRLTEDRVIAFYIFDLLLMLLNVAGAMLFGVGLLVTIPVSMLAIAYLYRNVLVQTQTQDAYYAQATTPIPA